MSAFCGFLNLDSAPASPEWLAAQMRPLEPYGPDGSGTFVAGPMALGHVLLSITPESGQENSPWRSADGQRVIAFDGRLDHRDDLCAALGVPPHERSVPDPELILRAHEQWGADCAVRLEGEFAFALWDGRRQDFFCARDFFGRRDFFYHSADQRFTFASRIRSVLAVPGVPRALDELMLDCELACFPRPADRTFYAGIQRLPNACWLRLRPGGEPVIRRYWLTAGSSRVAGGVLNNGKQAARRRERQAEAKRKPAHSAVRTTIALKVGGADFIFCRPWSRRSQRPSKACGIRGWVPPGWPITSAASFGWRAAAGQPPAAFGDAGAVEASWLLSSAPHLNGAQPLPLALRTLRPPLRGAGTAQVALFRLLQW